MIKTIPTGHEPLRVSRRLALSAGLALAGSGLAFGAKAQTAAQALDVWSPKATVRMVVPFAAGGTSDIVARLLATRLAEALGQPVIIENRAGAGGNIGIASVARAASDGLTLLLASSSFVTNPALHPDKRPYEPIEQFAPISLLVTSPDVIVVPAKSAITSLADLLAVARTQTGGLDYATPGNGNSVHLGGELLWQRADVRMMHVPYSGAAPAVQAALAGQVDCALVALPAASPYLAAKTLRALAVGSTRRWAELAQVPTVAESGFPGYRSETMQALFAPAGTPAAVVSRLNAEVTRILGVPAIQARLHALGFDVIASTPAFLAARVAEEVPRWTAVAAQANIRAD
ncbi:tripartite tricarboxylate transporter substrate binding protein [Pantoea sp. 18069]|uniref:tripartite tricarboxylate transporter substrate binding protein n=1 Tax=Pantoea sp. 18069 TaxID=2681415 RepID=UPI00135B2E5F|nr:tripartite tricarboxylate transporter substrate binding protein [Pantoea sp. 18069]